MTDDRKRPATSQNDEELEFEAGRIPPETWDEFFRLVRLGIHRTGTVMESLGYRRQCVTMKKSRDPEFRRAVERAEAQGRIQATQEMIDVAKKAGQWQALSRRLEIVHGECHPLDEAKVASLRQADAEALRMVSAAIESAFETLPIDFDKQPVDGEQGGGEQPQEPQE